MFVTKVKFITPLQDLYGYVFACIGIEVPFCLYLGYPRSKLPISTETVDDFGLLSGEVIVIDTSTDSVEFNPLILFSSYLPHDQAAGKVSCLMFVR